MTEKVNLFLDSGAYSAMTQGVEIDIDKYIQFIHNNIDDIEMYANLDVIGDDKASWDNWQIMRSNGLNPVGVFHMGEDKKYLYHYLDNAGHESVIAIGGIAGVSQKVWAEWLERTWEFRLTNDKGYPIAKIHGFGMTSLDMMCRYPWYSLDSTTWIQHAAYGKIIVAKGGEPVLVRIGTGGDGIHQYHINKKGDLEQKHVLDYVKENGFDLEELKADYVERIKLNMIFFNNYLNQLNVKRVPKKIPTIFVKIKESQNGNVLDLSQHKLRAFMAFSSKNHNDLLNEMRCQDRLISYYFFINNLKKYNTLKEFFYEDQT